MIFRHPSMKKYRSLLYIIHKFIIFHPRFFRHLRALLSFVFLKLIQKAEKISQVKQKQVIILNEIWKKSLIKNLDNFLKLIRNISKNEK